MEKRVPAMAERVGLITTAAESLGFPGSDRLAQLLSSRYYWKGLSRDCL